MSTLLLNLRNVPDDEADEVRALLDTHAIGYYETHPSRWGVSAGALWIADDEQAAEAKRVMAAYQAARQARAREDYANTRRDGSAATVWTVIRDEPLRVLLTVIATALLIGLVALPIFLIAR